MEFLLLEERGAALWLTWGNFSALIPTGKISMSSLHPPYAPDILVLPDNLEADAFSMEILNQWAPSLILFPLEESDLPFTGQHQVLALLEDYPVISSLDYSWVRITTDGKKLWVNGD
jgi:hypothetical protein